MFRNLFKSTSDVPETGRRARLALTEWPAAIYAIGDVHGCFDELRILQGRIVADAMIFPGRKLLVFLGDYVDRGPQSAAVIDLLTAGAPADFDRICLCGNHEAMMLNYLQTLKDDSWLKFGGVDTLSSYGINARSFLDSPARQQGQVIDAHMPREHIDWLESLPILLTVPGYVFVHAGVRPDVALADQKDRDLLWIRDEFLDSDYVQPDRAVIVHGHTPAAAPVIDARHIDVDTSAYSSGVLTAVRLRPNEAPVFIDTR